MPLLRIDLPQSIDAGRAQRIGEVVSKGMIESICVPNGDKFQVIARHSPEGRSLTSEHLGIHYSNDVFLLQITLKQGRTVELKKVFYRRVAKTSLSGGYASKTW
jgi:4-oxalocrotonate tautomerase